MKEKNIFIRCYFVFFVNGILALMIGAVLPFVRDTYQLSYQVAGMLISAHSVGNLISSFAGGILPFYMGRKKSILLLCSTGFIAFLLIAAFGQPVILVTAFFLTGICRGAISNFSNTMINIVAQGKAWALNLLHSIFAIGAFLAPYIVLGFTRQKEENWTHAVLLLSGLIFAVLLVYGTMKIPDNQPAKTTARGSGWDFLKNPAYLIACGIIFSYLCTEQAINGWLVTYLKDSGIMNSSFAQIMTSLLWLLILAGRLLTVFLSRRINTYKILLLNGAGYTIFFIILIASRSFTPAAIGIIGVGFFMAAIYPTTLSSISAITRQYPLALSVILTFGGLGAISMPMLIGIISDQIGIFGGMTTIIIAVAISFSLIVLQYYRHRKSKSPQPAN